MTEKKATELLVEMDYKLDLILSYMKNLDFNLKLQSDLKLKESKQASKIEPLVEKQSPPKEPKKEKEIIKTEKNPVVTEGASENRKVNVFQHVYYPNGKPAALATIKVFDSQKQEIKKTNSNHSGRWSALLDPGGYFVHITKAEVADKPKIDFYFEITVSPSNTALELESKK